MKTRRRRRAVSSPTKGWQYPASPLHGKPPRKLHAFKAGQVIPEGAEYLTFAIRDNVPHFFFLLPHGTKKKDGRTIGFRLS
jgi:hypothetical protein